MQAWRSSRASRLGPRRGRRDLPPPSCCSLNHVDCKRAGPLPWRKSKLCAQSSPSQVSGQTTSSALGYRRRKKSYPDTALVRDRDIRGTHPRTPPEKPTENQGVQPTCSTRICFVLTRMQSINVHTDVFCVQPQNRRTSRWAKRREINQIIRHTLNAMHKHKKREHGTICSSLQESVMYAVCVL